LILSGGRLTKGALTTIWQGSPATWPTYGLDLGCYGAIYRRQLWVAVLVNKIANASARLPLKVYERGDQGRNEARDHPYATLLRRPNRNIDPFLFWLWVVSTLNIYGESLLGKIRDSGGRPVELVPLHPSNVHSEDRNGSVVWRYDDGRHRVDRIERRDIVHFRHFNPDSLVRGLSPLEPLRATLENEDGARRANSAMWRNGGRPSVILRHPKNLSAPASKRLAAQWSELHGGVDNWAKTAILEEAMEATVLPLNVEELQYVESRRINREEACAVYDVPPPVVHILDRATFSNITEQMRSMYRDTMAPKLGLLESTLETELRDGRFDRDGEPDFGDEVYAEFLMDEVLRGDFEVRTGAMATAIQTGQLTPAEARRMENRPFIEGSDTLLVNGALVPLIGSQQPTEEPPIDEDTVRALMGRLSRQALLADIDPAALTAGLNGRSETVRRALTQAQADGLTVPEFRERLKALGGTHA
jgi:HK97 family phage portal protein